MGQVQPYSPQQLREFHDRNRPDVPNPIGSADLAEFMRDPGRWRTTASGLSVPAVQNLATLQVWMQGVYDKAGFKGPRIVVSPLPRISDKQKAALARFGMRLFFIPSVGEDAYPDSFVKPIWGKYLDASQIERRTLPGRWIAVETIACPNWDDPQDYGGGSDPVASALKLETRFGISWDNHHARNGTLRRLAKLGNFPKRSTRFGTAEELNFLGNLFNLLRVNRGMVELPDLGSTNSWEWCENAFESDFRVIVGHRAYGGLAALYRFRQDDPGGGLGFHVLVQF